MDRMEVDGAAGPHAGGPVPGWISGGCLSGPD